MEFERYAARALDTALQRGASYADLRYERIREERIEVRNGEVATLSDERSSGYGIRAFYEGAWGFAASDDMSNQGVDRTAARALSIPRLFRSVSESLTSSATRSFCTPSKASASVMSGTICGEPRRNSSARPA